MSNAAYLRCTCLALSLCAFAAASAEEPACGVSAVTQTTRLIYPVIARAAHVSGVVIVRAGVAQDGTVDGTEVWQGDPMLRQAALDFVNGFRANAYGGSRSCLFSIAFNMQNSEAKSGDPNDDIVIYETTIASPDPLHYSIIGKKVARTHPVRSGTQGVTSPTQ